MYKCVNFLFECKMRLDISICVHFPTLNQEKTFYATFEETAYDCFTVLIINSIIFLVIVELFLD